MMRRWPLNWIAGLSLALMAGAAMAEVYATLPLDPLETLVVRYAGQTLSLPTEAIIQGRPMRVSRWLLPLDLTAATRAVEADMHALLGGAGGLDAIQAVTDDAVVFAAVSPDLDGADGPRYGRTLLLRPSGTGTELIVTEELGPLETSAVVTSTAWSLDGLSPEWSSIEHQPGGDLATFMFVYPAGVTGVDAKRTRQLGLENFEIVDFSKTSEGKMLTARRGDEQVTFFSYIDETGLLVEVVNYQTTPVSAAGDTL